MLHLFGIISKVCVRLYGKCFEPDGIPMHTCWNDFTLGQDLLLKKGNARPGNSVYVKITTPSIRLSLYCNIFIVTWYVDHPQTSFTFLTFSRAYD